MDLTDRTIKEGFELFGINEYPKYSNPDEFGWSLKKFDLLEYSRSWFSTGVMDNQNLKEKNYAKLG